MRVKLKCECTIDDVRQSTTHHPVPGVDEKRSKGDITRNKNHYPLDHPPRLYCLSCDLHRPCSCDIAALA